MWLAGPPSEGPRIDVRISLHMAELVLHRGSRQGCKVLARNQLRKAGYSLGKSESFWFSLNPDDGDLKYGKGSRMLERTFLQYSLLKEGSTLCKTQGFVQPKHKHLLQL